MNKYTSNALIVVALIAAVTAMVCTGHGSAAAWVVVGIGLFFF